MALEEADALVMVVDARTELAQPDYDLARLLHARRQAAVSGGEQGGGRGDGGGGGELPPAGDSESYSHQLGAWAGIGELLDAIAEAIPEGREPENKRTREQGSEPASQQASETTMS